MFLRYRTQLLRRDILPVLKCSKYDQKCEKPGKRKIKKLLVANRGEIAVRICRACIELGIEPVTVYAKADFRSLHRTRSKESYEIGKGKAPLQAYLSIPDLMDIAHKTKCDAVHPGYGFLAENAEFAQTIRDAGLIFVGPTPEVVRLMGDKVLAKREARKAGINVIPGSEEPIKTKEEALAFCKKHGLPVILKAAFGGGGRGLRVVRKMEEVEKNFVSASGEAKTAFGNGAMFIEKFVVKPRHIEVQVLGDKSGKVVHLFERDCSVQRRHQKVIELAPAPFLDDSIRHELYESAVRLCKSIKYENAGTVEFLCEDSGNNYFLEVNPRLQVEHTVTEEVTGIDIVQAQIKIAQGETLWEQGIAQETIKLSRSSIQCRVTTEDPANNFIPDIGRLDVCRNAGSMGIRLDSASLYTGYVVSPHYDSLLVKVISTAKTFEDARVKMIRALKETIIRGVKTNIPFMLNVLESEDFKSGCVNTDFIKEHPELTKMPYERHRAKKILTYLSEVLVNGPLTPLGTDVKPKKVKIVLPKTPKEEPPRGFKQIYMEQGPEGFAKAVRNHKGLLLTDTTFRDAHQSLLATRVRTKDLLLISPFVAHNFSHLFSIENWGGATFDVALRFLHECPWERIERMRKKIPNIPFQMLLRGANAVGYTNYPDNVVYKFCELAVQCGVDVFRVFDSLNYLPNLIVGMNAVGKAGGIIEAAISYTGDVSDPKKKKYDLKYYMKIARELVKAGTHVLAIKDMAGVIKPQAASLLVKALRDEFPEMPIHIHTHDTSGAGVASMIKCAEAGADVVDVAIDSMSGMTSQPSMGAMVASLTGTKYHTGFKMESIYQYSAYWELTRTMYGPFECTTTLKSGNSDVFINEIPGGQYTNLQFQAYYLGMGHLFEKIKMAYYEANMLLGDIIKVTPSSKVVGDLAQFMVQNKLKPKDVLARAGELSFPRSVVEYFRGFVGQPYGGFPEPLRTNIVKKMSVIKGRPGESLPPFDFKKLESELKKTYPHIKEKDVMSAALYPNVTKNYLKFKSTFGPVERLNSRLFFVGPDIGEEFDVPLQRGLHLKIKLLAIAKHLVKGSQRELFFEVNGTPRTIFVVDKSAVKKQPFHPKANPKNPKHIGAPMPGTIIDIKIKVGDSITKGMPIMVLSAMKLETTVNSPVSGKVKKVMFTKGSVCDASDLLVVLE